MLDELKTKLVSRLTTDSALMALLHTTSGVVCGRLPATAPLPCITVSMSEAPSQEPDGVGKYEVELQINAYGDSADTNDAVIAALDARLFDAHRGGALDTTSYRVTFCRRVSSRAEKSDVRQSSLHEVEKRETVWRLILLKKNA